MRTARLLSYLTAAVAGVASSWGLLDGDLYAGAESTVAMLRAYDLVTLVVAVPLLLWALRRTTVTGRLVHAGVLANLVYGYATYLFGTGFNDAFLLHVAVFTSSLAALVTLLARPGLDFRDGGGTATRVVAVLLGLLGAGLGGMWVFVAIRNAATGYAPQGSVLVETGTIVHLGMALDLALLVPAYLLGAVLLWRRRAAGHLVAPVVLVAGVFHQVSYLVALLGQSWAEVPEAKAFDAGEPIVIALFVAGAWLALGEATRQAGPDEPDPSTYASRKRTISS